MADSGAGGVRPLLYGDDPHLDARRRPPPQQHMETY